MTLAASTFDRKYFSGDCTWLLTLFMTSIAITLARCAFQGYWAGGESIDEVFNRGPLFPCLLSSFFILSFPFVFFAFFFSIPVAPLFFVLSPLFAHAMERNSDIRQASMKPHRFRSISASSINRALSLFFSISFFSLCAHRYSPEREYLGREGEEGVVRDAQPFCRTQTRVPRACGMRTPIFRGTRRAKRPDRKKIEMSNKDKVLKRFLHACCVILPRFLLGIRTVTRCPPVCLSICLSISLSPVSLSLVYGLQRTLSTSKHCGRIKIRFPLSFRKSMGFSCSKRYVFFLLFFLEKKIL